MIGKESNNFWYATGFQINTIQFKIGKLSKLSEKTLLKVDMERAHAKVDWAHPFIMNIFVY